MKYVFSVYLLCLSLALFCYAQSVVGASFFRNAQRTSSRIFAFAAIRMQNMRKKLPAIPVKWGIQASGLAATSWWLCGRDRDNFRPIKSAETHYPGDSVQLLSDRFSPAWDPKKREFNRAAEMAKNNPLDLLCSIEGEFSSFMDGAAKILSEKGSMEQIGNTYDPFVRGPLSLTHECTECGLSRKLNPQPRAAFEKEVADAITQRARIAGGKVTYVDIGSGHLFQLGVTLAHALSSPDVKELSIHIIDPNNAYQDFIGNHKKTDGYLPLNGLWKRANAWRLEEDAMILSEKIQQRFTHDRFQQLAAWCEALAPHTKCRIFVHRSCDDYSKSIQNGEVSAADVISFADPDPNFPYHIARKFCALINESARYNKLPPVGIGLFAETYIEKSRLTKDKELSYEAEEPRIVVARLWKGAESAPEMGSWGGSSF